MICPNCHNGKFPGMEIRQKGIHILVCTRCGWRGEPQAGYDEALFDKWEVVDAPSFDEAGKIPLDDDDWRRWPGVDPSQVATPSHNPYAKYWPPHYASVNSPDGYHFAFGWSDEERELLKKLTKEARDELKRRFGIDI